MWPKENMPAEALVYMRVHKNDLESNEVHPNVFRDRGDGMSVDWNKYSTPAETRARARQPAQNYGVLEFNVGTVREIEGLVVEHDPIQEGVFDERGELVAPNRAHSQVFGKKTAERRVKLARVFKWLVRAGDPV